MENSFKSNDYITATSISPVSDEERVEERDELSSTQLEQLTGTQMKEIEVKKIEDEINIKRLEKEYRDMQKGLAYSMKTLNEYRKENNKSVELIKRQVVAREGIIETSNGLKVFLNEVILVNLDNAEKKSAEGKKTIAELTMTFQEITARENHSNSLKEALQCKESEVNNNIARQIDLREEEYNKRHEKLTKSTSRIEALKKELNQQTINSNLKELIERKGKRIIELEAEEKKLQKQLKQELDAVLQDKNKLIQEKTNNKKSVQENDKLTLTLQSEISVSEKNKSDLEINVKKLKIEKEDLFNNVAKERQNVELSKNALAERDADIESEISKIKDKKQILINNFTIAEESMQIELKKLYDEINLKKSLLQKLENCERILWKLNEKKLLNKKLLSNSVLEDKLQKAKEDFKKHEEILSNFNKKKNNLELKIKELEEKKIQDNKKLESSTLENEKTLKDKHMATPEKLNTTKNEVIIKNVQFPSKSVDITSIFSYRSSDSEESEDEYKIRDETRKNTKLDYTPLTQIKSLNQADGKEQSSSNSTVAVSSNELFDNLFNKFSASQTATRTEDTTDVFKLPQLPLSQYKKKTPQPKKKN